MMPSQGFNEQFEVLRRAYSDRIEEKVSGIEAGWRHYLSLPAGAEKLEALSTVHRLTHSLAGSGATFGFPLISQFARRAEMVLKDIAACAKAHAESADAQSADAQSADAQSADAQSADAQSADAQSADAQSADAQSADLDSADAGGKSGLWKSQSPNAEQHTEIEAAHAGLRAAASEREQPGARLTLEQSAGVEGNLAPGGAEGAGETIPISAPAAKSSVASERFLQDNARAEPLLATTKALIYMFCENPEEVPGWAASVETFGYRLQIYGDAYQLRAAATREMPAALIISSESEPIRVGNSGEPLGGVLHELKKQGDHPVPLIWVCDNGDLRARLQAVRLGASAFFTHPIDVDALLVKLDDLTALHTPEPFRVLIVDDEPALARLYSLILRGAGMETREVTDPLEVMAPLVDFRPDLILMDVYMPGCNGSEIAAVIRQQEAYVGIPIMFLSSESDTVKQLEAMRLGGDEFLQKPVQPRYLISSVLTRATRARVLQNLMIRDSLTGLLNHTKTKEQLSIEIERMRRLGHDVSLAMIDIDHFKTVNDTYGHATGDRVLRSLSRLLSQRMRQTDIVGRYGGEEFAVIMVGASAENARKAIDKVRDSWAQLPHFSNGREFYSTFSAGVASAPPHSKATDLSEAADGALYEAKGAGRNRVVLSRED